MTYWALNAFFLGVVALVALAAVVKGRAGRTAADPRHPNPRHADPNPDPRHPGPHPAPRNLGPRHPDTGPRWTAVGLSAIALLITTAVFDNVMIAIGLVAYNPDLISGAFVGIAPLEDFAYAIAAVVLLPSLWHLLPSTGSRRSGDTRRSRGSGAPPSSGTAAGGPRA